MFVKTAIILSIASISVAVPPPRWRASNRLQRLEAPPASSQPPAEVPHTVYGPPTPAPSYGPPPTPSASYGPPGTTEASITTTEIPVTTEPNSEPIPVENAKLQEGKVGGFYYIYHPNGVLQKVTYATRDAKGSLDVKLKYQNVEPIRGPVYTYDPQTFTFQQVAV